MLFSTSTGGICDRPSVGYERGVKMIVESGFPAVDLNFAEYERLLEGNYLARATELRSVVESAGGVFNQSHAPCGGGFEVYTKQKLPFMPKVIEFVGRLGVKVLVVHPLQRGVYYGQAEELFELNMKMYSSLAPYAKAAGIKIGIENMWHNHSVTGRIVDDTCADPRELVRYYDTLADPEAFTVCLDLGHTAICGRDPAIAIKTVGGERLGAIHAHDVDYVNDLHTVPGLSMLDWDSICRSLAEIDYKGDFTLEPYGFIKKAQDCALASGIRFMADSARYWSERIDSYRK